MNIYTELCYSNNYTSYTGLIDTKEMEMCELLQEQLQRSNNLNEGAALMELPEGTSMLLLADPSPLNKDSFAAFGVAKRYGRLFSNMMGNATHDNRQYTDATTKSTKRKKYGLVTPFEVSA